MRVASGAGVSVAWLVVGSLVGFPSLPGHHKEFGKQGAPHQTLTEPREYFCPFPDMIRILAQREPSPTLGGSGGLGGRRAVQGGPSWAVGDLWGEPALGGGLPGGSCGLMGLCVRLSLRLSG